jgi:hypothetical protein
MISSLIVTLVLTVGATLLSGGEEIKIAEDFEKTIKKCTDDDAREERALAQMASVREELEAHQAEIVTAISKYSTVDRAYNATLSDYGVVNAAIDEVWDKADVYFLDQVFSMKDIFTAEEWQECIAVQDKRMDKKTKKAKKASAKAEKKLKKEEIKIDEAEQDAKE